MYKLKRGLLFQVMFLCLLVLGSGAAFAAGTISISKTSDTTFEVVANGLGAPSGLDLTVTYDSSKLGNPRVDKGGMAGGAMLAANTGITGKIRIALVSHPSMGGTGTVVTITFDKVGDSTGNIGISGTAITQGGATIQVGYSGFTDTSTQTAGGGTGDTNTGSGSSASAGSSISSGGSGGSGGSAGSTSTTTTVTTVTRGTGSGTNAVGGTLTMPTDDTGMARKDTVESQPVGQAGSPDAREAVAPTPSAGVSAAPEAPAVVKKHEKYRPYAMTSVLEKFRLYTGEKTPQKLSALFDVDPAAPISQDPAVGISDGKSTVTVLISHVPGEKAPNFSFSHARYVSMQQAGEGEWQLEVRPEKGAVRASVTMLVDGVQQDIPLAVAPKVKLDLDKSGKVDEGDFQRFLKSRGTGKAPEFDLNGDGKRDYLDDYLFTANYLARQDAQSQK